MASGLSFAQLEQAASHIVRLIADTPGLENTRLAVIGDLAICKYLPNHGRVASIDLVISKSSSPGRVRKEIVGHPITPLVEKAGTVIYRHIAGWEIEVKLMPDWLCSYLPAAARPVKDHTNGLPYASLEDLVIFTMDACGMHENATNKCREAHDAAALLELASEHGALKLDEENTERAEMALADVIEFSGPEYDRKWWQRCLGISLDNPRSPQEILSDIAAPPASSGSASPTSPSVASSRSSVYSSISRASSYASTHSSISLSSLSEPVEKKTRPRKMSITKKTPRHRRHTSIELHMQRLELDRPASPGIALTNRIS